MTVSQEKNSILGPNRIAINNSLRYNKFLCSMIPYAQLQSIFWIKNYSCILKSKLLAISQRRILKQSFLTCLLRCRIFLSALNSATSSGPTVTIFSTLMSLGLKLDPIFVAQQEFILRRKDTISLGSRSLRGWSNSAGADPKINHVL